MNTKAKVFDEQAHDDMGVNTAPFAIAVVLGTFDQEFTHQQRIDWYKSVEQYFNVIHDGVPCHDDEHRFVDFTFNATLDETRIEYEGALSMVDNCTASIMIHPAQPDPSGKGGQYRLYISFDSTYHICDVTTVVD